VVIAIIAIVAALLLPALSRAKAKAQAVACLNNHKQATLAWYMYSLDNNDWLVPNEPILIPGQTTYSSWAVGDIRYGNPDGTNIDYIIGPHKGSLGQYVKTQKIFKCPTDRSTTTLAGGAPYPRVRSYSMNGFMGARILDNGTTDPAATFLKRSDFSKVHRPELLVFMDEHADSLTTSIFSINWDTYIKLWSHLPSGRHSNSGVMSYTDGHAEIHRWREARTLVPERGFLQGGFIGGVGVADPSSRDWQYVFKRMTDQVHRSY